MDQEIIVDAIRGAVEEVFCMMIGLPATAGEIYTEEGAAAEAEGVITLIGVAGSWIGTGSITCSSELACQLSSSMLMEEFPSINKEVLDAMAEITNMVFGNVKTVLESHLGALGLSIPTVVFGRNFSTNSPGHQVWNVIPYEVGAEKMVVKMCLAEKDMSAKNGAAGLAARTRSK